MKTRNFRLLMAAFALTAAIGAARSSQAIPIQWCGGDLDRCDEGGWCIQTDALVASCRDCPGNSCQYW
jgi:hypothetical protein